MEQVDPSDRERVVLDRVHKNVRLVYCKYLTTMEGENDIDGSSREFNKIFD
jgi:hypothetical protein